MKLTNCCGPLVSMDQFVRALTVVSKIVIVTKGHNLIWERAKRTGRQHAVGIKFCQGNIEHEMKGCCLRARVTDELKYLTISHLQWPAGYVVRGMSVRSSHTTRFMLTKTIKLTMAQVARETSEPMRSCMRLRSHP